MWATSECNVLLLDRTKTHGQMLDDALDFALGLVEGGLGRLLARLGGLCERRGVLAGVRVGEVAVCPSRRHQPVRPRPRKAGLTPEERDDVCASMSNEPATMSRIAH